MTNHRNNFLLFCLCVMSIFSLPAFSQSTSISLQDVLAATIENQQTFNIQPTNDSSVDHRLSWIDGVPSASAQYFHNQNSFGSKETEISIDLPIKSRLKAKLEKDLQSASEGVRNSAQEQLALYYSGLIRELIWAHKIKNAEIELLAQKRSVLSKLYDQVEVLTKRNALPEYMLFLIRKELNDFEVLNLEYTQQVTQNLSQYRHLTGLSYFPDNIKEPLLERPLDLLNQHPDVKALDQGWRSQSTLFDVQSKSSEPWSLSVKARRIESPGFSENQIGIGVDVPISIGSEFTAIQQTEYQQAKLIFEVTRNKLQTDLLSNIRTDLSHYQFLIKRQGLLQNSLPNIVSLEKAIQSVLDSNNTSPDNRATLIRFIIDSIDAKADIKFNELSIQQQISRIRQSSGVSL